MYLYNPWETTECPACANTGFERDEDDKATDTPCTLCEGEAQVTLRDAQAWIKDRFEEGV